MRWLAVTFGLLLLWVCVVVAVVFVETTVFGAPDVDRGELASIESHLTRKLGDAAARRRMGSAALVLIQRGRIVAEHGFGAGPVKVDRTRFQVASVSKAVTAWGVMKLVQDGRIGLDEPVMRHLKRWRFPGSEAYRDRVTVRHLLSHTAGLDDNLGYGVVPGERVPTLEEVLTRARAIVVREPGTSMRYSSTGYAVLQLLVEDITNEPFAETMKESVLEPLGMTESSFGRDAGEYAPAFDRDLNVQPHRLHPATASVGLHTTPRDLARFVIAFTRENPVLERETLRRMLMPQPATGGTWGLGHTLYARSVVGHGGGTLPAWGAMVRVNPVTGNGLVLVVSGGSGALNRLPHDWVYWETGVVTDDARRQLIYDRIRPASIAMLAGAIALLLWRARSFAGTAAR